MKHFAVLHLRRENGTTRANNPSNRLRDRKRKIEVNKTLLGIQATQPGQLECEQISYGRVLLQETPASPENQHGYFQEQMRIVFQGADESHRRKDGDFELRKLAIETIAILATKAN
jgi:hypothetical protein